MFDRDDLQAVGACLILLLTIPVSLCLYFTNLYFYYCWFIMPLGAPAITLFHLFGAAIFISFLNHHASITFQLQDIRMRVEELGGGSGEDEVPRAIRAAVRAILFPLITLVLGYLLSTGIMV